MSGDDLGTGKKTVELRVIDGEPALSDREILRIVFLGTHEELRALVERLGRRGSLRLVRRVGHVPATKPRE